MSGEDDHYEDFDAPPPPPPSGEFPAHDYQMQGQQYYDQQQYPGQYQEDYGYDNVVEQQFNEQQEGNRQPPPPWERHYSVEDENFYYFNPDTGECFWENEEEDDEDEVMDEEEFEEFMQQHQSELQQLGYGSTNQQQEHHVEGDQYYHSQEAEHEAEQQYMYQQQQQQQQYPQDYPQEDFSQHYQHQPQPPYQQYQQQQQDYNQFESDDISLADLASIEIHADDQSVVSNMTGFRSVRSNMTDPNLSVVERSNLMLQYKQEKIESLRREQERQERDSMKQQPTITNKSKQKQRSVEDMLQWEKERQAKLQARAQMIDEQHRTEQTGRPQVTKLANKLAQRWREDEEDATLGNYDAQSVATSIASKSVQERLYEYEDRKKMKLQMMIDRQNYEARMNAKPKLVSRSANYVRGGQSVASEEGSVSERLYALAELRKVNPMPSMINGSKPIQHDETTGQRLFEPKINRTSEKLANRARATNVPIEDWLYMKGIEYQRKVEVKERRKVEQEQYMRGISKINPNSEKIVRDRYLMYGESAADRLHRPIGTFKEKTIQNMNKFNFKPKISEGSMEILQQGGNRYRYFPPDQEDDVPDDMSHIDSIIYGESNGQAICVDGKEFSLLPQNKTKVSNRQPSGVSMYERTLYWEEQRKKRLDQERMEHNRAQMRECSFKPKVDPNSKVIQSSKGNIADRHASWMKDREDKLAVKRQQQAIDEIKDCTFIPKVPIPASTSLGGRARSGSKSSNKQPLYEEASSLVPEQGSGKSSSTNTNSKPIEEAPKVRFREGGNNQHVDNYNDWQVPSAPQPPQRTTDYSAFDFGDDEYTPKVSVNRVRPPVVPSQHIPSQPYQQQPSYPQSNPPQYYSQPPSQHQPVQQQYLPPQYATMSSRPTDLQEPDDYPQSPSSWIPPQQYGADFNALELKAQKALRNSFPSSEGSQYSDISYDQQPPSNYYQQQGYYPQQQMPLPQSYPRSPTNPYNMHYYADPQDDDMSQAVEL